MGFRLLGRRYNIRLCRGGSAGAVKVKGLVDGVGRRGSCAS